jgi:hypothetical protein
MKVLIQYEKDCTHATELISTQVWKNYNDFFTNHHIEIPLNIVGIPNSKGYLSVSQFFNHINIFSDTCGICKILLPKYHSGTFRLLTAFQQMKNNHKCTRNCWV